MKKLVTIGLLAIALVMGYNTLADKPIKIPKNQLVVLGVNKTNDCQTLVLAYRGLPNKCFVLQGSSDLKNWTNVVKFKTHDAAHPFILEVPMTEEYFFFRVAETSKR